MIGLPPALAGLDVLSPSQTPRRRAGLYAAAVSDG